MWPNRSTPPRRGLGKSRRLCFRGFEQALVKGQQRRFVGAAVGQNQVVGEVSDAVTEFFERRFELGTLLSMESHITAKVFEHGQDLGFR